LKLQMQVLRLRTSMRQTYFAQDDKFGVRQFIGPGQKPRSQKRDPGHPDLSVAGLVWGSRADGFVAAGQQGYPGEGKSDSAEEGSGDDRGEAVDADGWIWGCD
jgi:hypothetical protein